jgi:hypothetical protein
MKKRAALAVLACALIVACSRAPAPSGGPALAARTASQRSQDEVNACRGPGGKWMCSTPAPLTAGQPTVNPATWRVAAWVVDGQNASGTASDSNGVLIWTGSDYDIMSTLLGTGGTTYFGFMQSNQWWAQI